MLLKFCIADDFCKFFDAQMKKYSTTVVNIDAA